MRPNENIENNGFENFEDQGRYKSVTLAKQRKADLCAKIAVAIFIVSLFILGIDDFIKVNPIYETSIGINIKRSDGVILILYSISCLFAIIGFFIKRTNITRAIFIFTTVLPLALIVSAITCYLLLYILFYPLIQLAWGSM